MKNRYKTKYPEEDDKLHGKSISINDENTITINNGNNDTENTDNYYSFR